jgi:uncharacterized membrane protein YfcA
LSAEILLLIAGAALAGLVQGMSGFAFSMVAMSIWVWGVEPRVAAVMAVFGGLVGQLLSAITVRRGLRWPLLLPFLAGGLVGVPVGVWALPHLNAAVFKLSLGLFLVVCCPAMLASNRLPRISAGGRIADGVAGAVGGVMGGFGGFTGVVPTLWCTLRGYDKDLQRNLIQNFNLAALAATMAAYVVTGAVTPDLWPKFAVVAPALIVPGYMGARIYLGLSEAAFRRLVLVLLSCAGLAMVAAALPGVLGR